jgi:hypothetical protein
MTYPARPVPPAPRVWPWWVAPSLLVAATMLNVGCYSPRAARENEDTLRCLKVLNRIEPPMALGTAAAICEEASR